MEIKACDRHVGISAQKVRLVADLVRGMPVSDALSTLEYTQKAGSRYVGKLLSSAVANAGARDGVDVDTLFVKTIFVDEGPTMKRFRARSMGRGTRILKRSCHITVVLDEG
ncbi:MAG: 50S ribosomal protein L22 [Deltaproteobacteria bacterium]|nr:50S ribosomal protein L22 [Deltaproteobacteria bacterium]